MTAQSSCVAHIIGTKKHRWLVTGVAGFIGSHLLENLLLAGQHVRGVDNFATGRRINLEDVRKNVGEDNWKNFELLECDIRDVNSCSIAMKNIEYVLHQAALGSVPKSIENPHMWNEVNVAGTLNMMIAAKSESSVQGFVYASSSSVYGDSPDLPKQEEKIGKPLSPYAVSKLTDELYAQSFATCYGFYSVGLRYFNVFGSRQDPNGAYAAVIPKWLAQMSEGKECVINGDGTTSRDFCYIDNVVQANVRGALQIGSLKSAYAFNVGVGENTNLLQLHDLLAEQVTLLTGKKISPPTFADFRLGDVKHSLASIDKIKSLLQYVPTHTIRQGIALTVPNYIAR